MLGVHVIDAKHGRILRLELVHATLAVQDLHFEQYRINIHISYWERERENVIVLEISIKILLNSGENSDWAIQALWGILQCYFTLTIWNWMWHKDDNYSNNQCVYNTKFQEIPMPQATSAEEINIYPFPYKADFLFYFACAEAK